MWGHVFVSVVINFAVYPFKNEVSDEWEQNEQNRIFINLEHEHKSTNAGNCTKNYAKKDFYRFCKLGIGVFDCKSIFIVKIAVFKTFKFYVSSLFEDFLIKFFVYLSIGNWKNFSLQIRMIKGH